VNEYTVEYVSIQKSSKDPNFLPKAQISFQKEIWAFGRKFGRK
jgi:hypothetical protein